MARKSVLGARTRMRERRVDELEKEKKMVSPLSRFEDRGKKIDLSLQGKLPLFYFSCLSESFFFFYTTQERARSRIRFDLYKTAGH